MTERAFELILVSTHGAEMPSIVDHALLPIEDSEGVYLSQINGSHAVAKRLSLPDGVDRSKFILRTVPPNLYHLGEIENPSDLQRRVALAIGQLKLPVFEPDGGGLPDHLKKLSSPSWRVQLPPLAP